MTVMANGVSRQVQPADFLFWVRVLTFDDGTRVSRMTPASVRPYDSARDAWWYMEAALTGDHLGYFASVRYQVVHMPSGIVSPEYHHDFPPGMTLSPSLRSSRAGRPCVIGFMRQFPLRDAWPELAAAGWKGRFLQFTEE